MAQPILFRYFCRICSKTSFSTYAIPTIIGSNSLISSRNLALSFRQSNIQNQQNCIRQKYSGRQKSQGYDSGSDSDEEDFENERDSKIVKTKLNSLRADLVLKSGLNLARNKIETHFYESKIRVNGEKLLKKSVQLSIGDEIDIIKGPSPLNKNHLLISRVEILAASPKDDSLSVVLRRYKTMTIENYKDAWCQPSE